MAALAADLGVMRTPLHGEGAMLTALLIAIIAFTSSDVALAADRGFGSHFRVLWSDDSIWGRCDMGLHVTPEVTGSVTTECRWEDGPAYKKERPLSKAEIGELRTLLRAADLFQGQSWGRDMRGVDLNFLTLQVDDGHRSLS
jgi:hypothetical protein